MRLSRLIFTLSILAFFAIVAVFGLHITMMTDSHGNMGTCPFMQGTTAICRMNIMEHISGWQSTFTTTIPSIVILLVVLALLFGSRFNFENNYDLTSQRSYGYRNSLSTVFNYLRIAFSRGILHSKIYDFSPIVG